MKPSKNRIYCIGCRRYKMLFDSLSKANNFIKFNSDEIADQSNKVPSRSYYCSFCSGWHVTSITNEALAKDNDKRDLRLWDIVYSRRKKKLSQTPGGAKIVKSLKEIDQLIEKCKLAIIRTDLQDAQEYFKEITLKYSLVEDQSKVFNIQLQRINNRKLKINALAQLFNTINNYYFDEENGTIHAKEHITMGYATLIVKYFENRKFFEKIHQYYNQAKKAHAENNYDEVLNIQEVIINEFKNKNCLGLANKKKYYQKLFNDLSRKSITINKSKNNINTPAINNRKIYIQIIELLEEAYLALENYDNEKCISLIKTAECLLPGCENDTEIQILSQIEKIRTVIKI